jgi:predicted nucleotidyltransferase
VLIALNLDTTLCYNRYWDFIWAKSLKNMNQSLKTDRNSYLIQTRLGISQQKLEVICHHWKITELALFGSILRLDFTEKSDIDILVTFADEARWGLIDFIRLNQQLETEFKRSVDLITKQSIEKSKNWLRKREILQTAEVIYATGSDNTD